MARIHGATSNVAAVTRRPARSLTVGALGGLIALTAGCSLTASTSTTSKTTLKPVLAAGSTGAGSTVFATVPFSATTAPPTVPPAAGATGGTVAAGAPGGDGTYEVQPNDTLSGIAARLGVPYADLVAANPEIDPKKFLIVGQKLNVPQGVAVAPAPPSSAPNSATATTVNQSAAQASGQTYTVVANDYFLGIAKKLGVPLASLLSVNNMTADSLITPGMKLKVPVGGKVPKATASTTTTVKKP